MHNVLEARYRRRDAAGKVIETRAQLFECVAYAVAEAELLGMTADARSWEERFYRVMASLDFSRSRRL
jgi:ribonucleotide reductase alpha subunit